MNEHEINSDPEPGTAHLLYLQEALHGGMYSASFGLTLIGLTIVSALLMLAVTSITVLSLGMVGTQSIVRFCSAMKS